jgi:16S rRNA (cytosine967-C5)-methyltransferase
VARWVARWGAEETRALLESNNREGSLIVRPWGVVREQLEAMLEASGVEVTDVPLVPDSLQLAGGTLLTSLGAFQQGRCFVQDPAATLVTQYAAIPAGAKVADLCAARARRSNSRTASYVTRRLERGAPAATAGDDRPARLGSRDGGVRCA